MKSFADAVNMVLAPTDYDKFVDSGITGDDRQLAIQFLKLMPANMRGDFTYVDYRTGKVLSNRLDLEGAIIPNAGPKMIGIDARSHITATQRSPLSFPPYFGSGGPFIRNYSYQGANAIIGYATPPCDATLQSSDSGNMYFNAYGVNASGSAVDGGLTAPGSNPTTLNVFINVAGSGYLYNGWTNESQRYSCGTHIGMWFGTLNTGSVEMLAVGIPTYDPTQFQLPPSTITFINSAWNFFPIPIGLSAGANPGTSYNYPSPCLNCYVARMFTIANGGGLDGSCYGGCNPNGPDGRWDQVVAGNFETPCSQTTSEWNCFIQWQSNWIAGEIDSGTLNQTGGVTFSEVNDEDGLEGINEVYTGSPSNSFANGRFALSLPIAPSLACTPDAHGYCYTMKSSAITGQCGPLGTNPRGAPIYLETTQNVYYIFQHVESLELVETATETIGSGSGAKCGIQTTVWSPNNPAVTFSDSSLP